MSRIAVASVVAGSLIALAGAAQGDQPVIVQIIGEGPAKTVQVDATQPMWRVVSH